MKVPSHIKRSKPTESYFGKWDYTVPCIPKRFENHLNISYFNHFGNLSKDYTVEVEEYIVEQCEFTIKDDAIILPEEFRYEFGYGISVPQNIILILKKMKKIFKTMKNFLKSILLAIKER